MKYEACQSEKGNLDNNIKICQREKDEQSIKYKNDIESLERELNECRKPSTPSLTLATANCPSSDEKQFLHAGRTWELLGQKLALHTIEAAGNSPGPFDHHSPLDAYVKV
ncbi:uncharacterized protein N7496_008526 [Penicillium cataractarum]|uniref:Uncharacterized protein n=1 Tax=Penicillium cataractarum TaxID=2100454 RepID=A0A9W9RYW9_9EURO|nr:uncharacterized protein N7496_008526 [Penicillium cataractarum]KAJ5368766.1 hypothetical protein N7496_008526 [Penicillium cataractarum]